MAKSELEELLEIHMRNDQVPKWEREWQFGFGRTRFDFAWPERKLAVEVEGGSWTGGRHSRGTGFRLDCEKYNEATLQGWRLLRFTGDQVRNGEARRTIEIYFARERAGEYG